MIAANYWIFQLKISFRSLQSHEVLVGWKIQKTMYPSLSPSHYTSVTKFGIINGSKDNESTIKNYQVKKFDLFKCFRVIFSLKQKTIQFSFPSLHFWQTRISRLSIFHSLMKSSIWIHYVTNRCNYFSFFLYLYISLSY